MKGERFQKAGSCEGFTLLELLISVTLVAVIILVATGALRLGYRSVESGEKKIEGLERFRASLSIIDAQVQSAVPLTYERDAAKRVYFEGRRDYMKMATNYSIWGGRRGYVVVEYTVQTDESGKMVLYASEGMVGTTNARKTTLLKGLDQIYFEYFLKEPTQEQGQWVDQWADDAKVPQKIRLRLLSGRKEISMIIPMRARGSLTEARYYPSATEMPSFRPAMGPGVGTPAGRPHGGVA